LYNVALAALLIVTIAVARRRFREVNEARGRIAVIAVVAGVTIAGLAGIASGLFGPDNQTIIGAPGQRMRLEGLGTVIFPLAENGLSSLATVSIERHDAGGFIVRTLPRDVAYVEARDLRGNPLTITQPTGAAFLSPVLLMQHRQRIAGLDLPFDSFNVPAERRVVKALLFTPVQAAMVLHHTGRTADAAVLFAVDDENDRPLPHAIVLSDGGRTVRAGGLLLRATVGSYPSVEIISAPNLTATIVGAILAIAGLIALLI
jgi:hypothetical protein